MDSHVYVLCSSDGLFLEELLTPPLEVLVGAQCIRRDNNRRFIIIFFIIIGIGIGVGFRTVAKLLFLTLATLGVLLLDLRLDMITKRHNLLNIVGNEVFLEHF
jgi:hypothetical protein